MRIDYLLTESGADEAVLISSNAETWGEQLEVFRRFLLACGFSLPDGELQFIDDEKEVVLSADEYNELCNDQ